jgi:hypothetical protein
MKGSEHHDAVEAVLTFEATDQPDIVDRPLAYLSCKKCCASRHCRRLFTEHGPCGVVLYAGLFAESREHDEIPE